MAKVGTEVGQKMRSAIKAKLMELGCYVDDELPDYIMVMVANKRTRSQMEDDLQLFLRADTKVFVDWLQQVLKKLKEVTVTNPEVYACSSFKELKRKATLEIAEAVIKKEKKDKKQKPEKKARIVELVPETRSLTDEIPVQAITLMEKRLQNNRLQELATTKVQTKIEPVSQSMFRTSVNEDNFDIPSLAEVNDLEDSELDLVEDKIKEARNRIVLMKSDSEDEDFINIRADAEELSTELDNSSINTNVDKESNSNNHRVIKIKRQNSDQILNKKQSPPKTVTINKQNTSSDVKPHKLPMSERLGARPNNAPSAQPRRTKISLAETLREEKEISCRIRSSIQSIIKKPVENKIQKRESVHKRLGVPSSVVSLLKNAETTVVETQPKSVMSVVQVKPRRAVAGPCQANKNLLLKAVAEAQKSVSQTSTKNNSNKEALFTKKYRAKHNLEPEIKPQKEPENGSKVQNIIIEVKSKKSKSHPEILDDDNSEYVPCSVTKDTESNLDDSEYVPNTIDLSYDEDDLDKYMDDFVAVDDTQTSEKEVEPETNHQFIVTLDGLKDKKVMKDVEDDILSSPNSDVSPKAAKKAPSPIIFEKKTDKPEPEKIVSQIPSKLPKVHVPLAVKAKERCKYWPNCRLKETCEYVHPNSACKMFPLCKFGDRCLYIHPKCKFDASCTRKDCPYSHAGAKAPAKIAPRPAAPYLPAATQDVCKYFPNCSNPHCHFYHPRPCRFGKFCLNKSECNFSHGNIPNKEKLTWHSNIR